MKRLSLEAEYVLLELNNTHAYITSRQKNRQVSKQLSKRS